MSARPRSDDRPICQPLHHPEDVAGTAIAGTILFSGLVEPTRSYGIAMIVLAFMGLLGLGAALLLPSTDPTPALEPTR